MAQYDALMQYIVSGQSANGAAVKEADRSRRKYQVEEGGQKIGMIYFGKDIAFEVTTRDGQLEDFVLEMSVNPIQAEVNGEETVASIGEPEFPDVAMAFLASLGYELTEVK